MQPSTSRTVLRRDAGTDTWLAFAGEQVSPNRSGSFEYTVLDSEEAVGKALLDELIAFSAETDKDIVFVLLGGRGAQAMYRLVAEKCEGNELDHVLSRLHVFTQDALAPMRMNNGLSFVRDFE